MSIPANATEAPTFAKVWQQVKGNAPTFAMIWGLILITALVVPVLLDSDSFVDSLLITILANLAGVLMIAVPAVYYSTDRCPKPGEIVSILSHKPLRYLLAGLQFVIVEAVGLLLCIIPGILVALTSPLYVHYVFTTDLNLISCLSKAFKLAMTALYLQNYIHYKGLVRAREPA